MTAAMRKFLELEKRLAEYKAFLAELTQATETLVAEKGAGSYFQDPSDGTVFKLVIPEGRFVQFDKSGFFRTRRAGEKAGSLSVKEAAAADFVVPESRVPA